MPNESLHLREIVQSRQQIFLRLLIVALVLSFGRYLLPWPTNWITFGINIALFILGVLIAPFTFLTETNWKKFLEKNAQLHFGNQDSPLRNGILFILLPVLGIFVLTSSRSPIGLGFLWGISAWYAGEVWQILRGNTDLLRAYFPTRTQQNDLPLQYILWGFCLYAILLTFGILFI